jgi:two-component system, OmpR family, sensor histidine kinase BaeS
VTQLAFYVVVGTLCAGLVAAFALRLLPTLRLQLAGLALVAVALPLGAVLLSGLVMFHMGDDVKILEVASVAALTAVVAAAVVGASIARRIAALQATSARVAAGDLAARAPEDGPQELRELGAAFNAMAANVEQLFDARRQLVAWASHDLRTPIASMRAILEAIEDGLATTDEYLPALREQTDRLASLVADLFELASIDAGSLALELQRVDLAPIVESCLRGVEAQAQSRGIRLERRVPGGVEALCAPTEVERILLNLLTNALRHTPADGSVAVVVERRGGEIEVSVEDSGEGISGEAEARMFERFWRGDAARSSADGGAGLGLAIAQALVDLHGGRIWAARRAEGGTRVAFTLPR